MMQIATLTSSAVVLLFVCHCSAFQPHVGRQHHVSFSSPQQGRLHAVASIDAAAAKKRRATLVSNNNKAAGHHMKRQTQKLSILAKSKDYQGAETLVKAMIANGETPPFMAYYHVLDAYGDSTHTQRAEEILNLLATRYEHYGTVAYNLALKICKNACPNDDALLRAERIWQHARDKKLADPITYSTFAGILANQKDSHAERILQLAESADGVINTQTWNNAMNAFVKGGDMEQAERILLLLETSFINNNNTSSNNNPLAPTVASYSIVMDGWAKQNKVEKAQDVFDRMLVMYHTHNNADAKPNAYPYVTLLHMYARQRNNPAYAAQAERLLFDMHTKSTQRDPQYPELKPNTQLITSCLDAWHKSGASNSGERGEALLTWMMEQEDPDMAPNRFTFCSAITAWAKSRQLGKPARARRILDQMIQLHKDGKPNVAPTCVEYTAVINACAYCVQDTIEQSMALRIAVATYKELNASHNTLQPNALLYATFLAALQNLVPAGPKKTQAALDVFHTAVQHGHVDHRVLSRIKSCVPHEALEGILPPKLCKPHIPPSAIPKEWCRNVVDQP